MTKKHLQFCIYYMQTGDPQVAYKMTYPHAAVKSLKASVSRLMARPDVAEWVNGTEERVHNRMMRQFHNEHYDQFKEKLLTINEKRTVLTKIIKGETKRVRYVKVKYGVQKVEEDLSADTVLRAIDLDTRLENFYNYLTRSDTWRKTQNIYVNTPTLQQQVNILINQTTETKEAKDVQEHILSPAAACPAIGGRGVTSVTGVELSRRDIPPYKEVPCEHRAEDVYSRTTGNTSPCPDNFGSKKMSPAACPDRFGSGGDPARAGTGVEPSRSTHHKQKTPRYLSAKSIGSLQKKDINKLTTEPVSSLTQKNDINRLTKVNNFKRHQDDDNNSPQRGCST